MMDFDEIRENFESFSIRDFAREKPLLFSIISFIIVFFVAGLIILLIQTSPEKAPAISQEEHFEANAPVLIPDAPQIEKDYYPSRVTENQWSQKEVDRWFTYPEDTVMTELKDANKKIVKDIIGSAP